MSELSKHKCLHPYDMHKVAHAHKIREHERLEALDQKMKRKAMDGF